MTVLIIELKRGGFNITKTERRQAEDYALEIKKSGKVDKTTNLVCYVLGSKISCEEGTVGEQITIVPQAYSTVLRRAHARTFNLIKKIEEIKGVTESEYVDEEIRDVLAQQVITEYES